MGRRGRRKYLVQLLKPVASEGTRGETLFDYQLVHEAFAGIEDIRNSAGNRKYKEDQDIVRGAKRIVMDYYPDFKSDWRILDIEMNQTYEVLSVDNPERRNRELILTCKTLEDV